MVFWGREGKLWVWSGECGVKCEKGKRDKKKESKKDGESKRAHQWACVGRENRIPPLMS